MKVEWKRITSWVIVVIGLLGVALSYYALWILIAYFAAGLVWFANLALLLSGPVSGIGGILAWLKPRQKIAMVLGILGFALWVLLWVLCFTVLGFRFQ
ncbi:MAG: hypothetical protein QOJ64_741 [Acidobacteriota bacterium]|jgi:hypothetical protein|nr:hypothetical protein [Acidobacteriota bacterium]